MRQERNKTKETNHALVRGMGGGGHKQIATSEA